MDTLKSFSDKDLTEAEERSLKEVAATIYIGNQLSLLILVLYSHIHGPTYYSGDGHGKS